MVIKQQGFEAVFVGEGTPAPRVFEFWKRRCAGQDLSGVMYGQSFLYEVSHGNIKPITSGARKCS